MTLPIISGYAAALLAILQVALMASVGNARRAVGVPLGDGGNPELLMNIRRHANLTESAPLFLILLALLEITGGNTLIVSGIAALYVLARISHAFALSGPDQPAAARAFGALGTLIGLAGTAFVLLWHLSPIG